MTDLSELIVKSEQDGYLNIKSLPTGVILKVQTKNTTYTIEVINPEEAEITIHGHMKYCPEARSAILAGSTWGGSALKLNCIGKDMHMEIHFFPRKLTNLITTSGVCNVTVRLPNGHAYTMWQDVANN